MLMTRAGDGAVANHLPAMVASLSDAFRNGQWSEEGPGWSISLRQVRITGRIIHGRMTAIIHNPNWLNCDAELSLPASTHPTIDPRTWLEQWRTVAEAMRQSNLDAPQSAMDAAWTICEVLEAWPDVRVHEGTPAVRITLATPWTPTEATACIGDYAGNSMLLNPMASMRKLPDAERETVARAAATVLGHGTTCSMKTERGVRRISIDPLTVTIREGDRPAGILQVDPMDALRITRAARTIDA